MTRQTRDNTKHKRHLTTRRKRRGRDVRRHGVTLKCCLSPAVAQVRQVVPPNVRATL